MKIRLDLLQNKSELELTVVAGTTIAQIIEDHREELKIPQDQKAELCASVDKEYKRLNYALTGDEKEVVIEFDEPSGY